VDAVRGHRVPPDGCVDLVYSREEGVRVVGTMTAEQRFNYAAGTTIVGVRFRPGMAGLFLRVPPAELTDLLVSVEQIWGGAGSTLTSRLDSAGSAAQCIALITAALPAAAPPLEPVHLAIEAITASHGAVDLDFIARQANLGARQFRRRCLEASGLTPKQLCRVLRFRRASALAARGRPRWSAIAAEAGYFDQAHLIRDFREFTGQTPMSVFSNTAANAGASMSA
jgi:AraC-like DNA-binding protein